MKFKGKIKVLKIALSVICGVSVLTCLGLYVCFFNEINTLITLKKINDNPSYEITYHGDYALEQYLDTGAKNWGEVLEHINKNLAHGIGKFIYGKNECSSFFAKTPDGDYIFARNLDTSEAIPLVIKTNPKKGYKTLGVANLLRGGWNENNPVSKLSAISSPYYTYDGMNEYGLAIAPLSVPVGSSSAIKDDKLTIHDITVARVVLDKAKNVQEAIELLSNYNVKMESIYPSHYMVADCSGNSVVIEYIDGEMKVVEMDGDYQIATNFILYKNEELKGYSSDRYMEFERTLSETRGILTVEDALDLLEENTVFGHAQWSVVYNLSKKTIAIEFINDYDHTYTYNFD